jgi:sulfur transfer complex TusBCD TusB component (DsrH family)
MLYLVDKPMAEVAFRTVAAADAPLVVLIQDGVVLDPDIDATLYAIERDVSVRGVDLPPHIEPIGYDTLMELVFEHETKSFV